MLTRSPKWGNILWRVFLLSVFVWITQDWFRALHSRSLAWILLVAVLLYPLPIMRMKRKAVRLALLGDYDGALRINRIWLPSFVYGRPFKGWIMLQAGRFSEALELLKPSAFDKKGRPNLTDPAVYNYAVTLMNEERYSEAQPLLESAVLVPQELEEYLRFSLAECLLSQNKEAGRACELVEQVIANRNRKTRSAQDRALLAQCMALHAWALASCERREEAEVRLAEVITEFNSLSKDDLAGLLLLKGKTWQALGDSETARAAFHQALAIFPYGSIGMSARRQLAKLSDNVT